jgi:ATP-dependent Clp protease ATP-binding subunit ClpC
VIDTEHLLLSILKDEDNIATQVLHKYAVTYDNIKEDLATHFYSKSETPPEQEDDEDDFVKEPGKPSGGHQNPNHALRNLKPLF